MEDDEMYTQKPTYGLRKSLTTPQVLTFADRFKALRFTATGAPPVARRILIFPMNQYA
jgi:hypothetical protein